MKSSDIIFGFEFPYTINSYITFPSRFDLVLQVNPTVPFWSI